MSRGDSICKNCINFGVPWNAENFLLDLKNTIFSRASQPHRVTPQICCFIKEQPNCSSSLTALINSPRREVIENKTMNLYRFAV
jgi:hypothetical protein